MTNPAHPNRRLLTRQRVFVLVQVVFVGLVAAGASHWKWQHDRRGVVPPLRQQPLKISPRYDWPWVVTDTQLLAVLDKAAPRLRRPRPNIGYVDHALRLWGPEAKFSDPACLSGAELRQILLDHATYSRVWGTNQKPLVELHADCAGFRTNQGFSSSPHVDHTLAGLAEIGTPLDHPVATATGDVTMRHLLEGSLVKFRLNQAEYEWSVLAYALFVQPNPGWVSKEGQVITFDRIAERIMRQPREQGVCQGHHRSHALVALLAVDEQSTILTPACRERIMEYLRETIDQLVQTQHPEGYWDQRWALGPQNAGAEPAPLRKRLISTGHAVEWMAFAPPEILPPRDVIVRAGQWLVRTAVEMDQATIDENYSFLTHAARSLAVWRGGEPADWIAAMDEARRPPAGDVERWANAGWC